MLKRFAPAVLLLILVILTSCSTDDEPKKDAGNLLVGTWKLKATTIHTYFEEELVDVEEDLFTTAPYRILDLKADGTASFETPQYEGLFEGQWKLDGINFQTDVRIEPGEVSSIPLYFFPPSEVTNLTASKFSLKSSLLWTQRDGKRYSYYIENFFEK